MRRYEITVGGHCFEVRVLSDPLQDRVEVEVDGQPLVVDVQDLDMDGGTAPSHLPSTPSAMTTVPSPAAPRPASAPAQGPPPSGVASVQSVAAPLPGIIKSIAVLPGQHVSPGDVLLVIEAMKMDNIIRASQVGVVDLVRVAEGHRVAHGDLMITYKE
jgi:biotin carboxyl carrier protein